MRYKGKYVEISLSLTVVTRVLPKGRRQAALYALLAYFIKVSKSLKTDWDTPLFSRGEARAMIEAAKKTKTLRYIEG